MELPSLLVFKFRLFHFWLQLGVGLSRPLPALRTEELIHVKSLFPFEHVIDGSAQLMSENRECLGLAVFGCKLFHVSLSRRVPSQKEYRGFREGPLEVDIADLFTGSSVSFPCRLFGALDQPSIGDEVLNCREAVDVMDLVENDQGQDLSNPGHRAQAMKSVDVMNLGRLGDVELNLGEQPVVVIDQREVHLHGLTHARFVKAFGHSFAVGLIGDLLADLREVILAVGILDVGEKLGAFAHQVHTATKQVAGGSHQSGIDVSQLTAAGGKELALLAAAEFDFR